MTTKTDKNGVVVTMQDKDGKDVEILFSFGTGRYSQLMTEAFKDGMRLFKWEPPYAEAYATALGAEYGRVLAGDAAVKFGKLTDDGKVNLRESLSIKGLTITPCLSIALAMVKANELSRLGFMPDGITITNKLAKEWVDKLFSDLTEKMQKAAAAAQPAASNP